MKKSLTTTAILLAILLASCTDGTAQTAATGTDTETASTEATTQETPIKSETASMEHYSVYDSGLYNDFDEAMAKNPVDAEYEKATAKASTTQELTELAKGLNAKWKAEMDLACANLKQHLTAEDAQLFESAQAKWEESIAEIYEIDDNILRDPAKHGVSAGSLFSSELLCKITDEYRARTIHVKYLTYLLEKEANTPTWNAWAVEG